MSVDFCRSDVGCAFGLSPHLGGTAEDPMTSVYNFDIIEGENIIDFHVRAMEIYKTITLQKIKQDNAIV